MSTAKEVARLSAEQKRQARVLEVAQQLRDAAQAEYDAAVAAHTALVAGFPTQLQAIDQRSAAAYERRSAAAVEHAEAASKLEAIRAECDAIDQERRDATAQHIADVDRSRQSFVARAPQLLVDYWLERATTQVARETAS